MIPKNISREHIIKAIKEIDVSGTPELRNSTKYDLLYMGKKYPPKYVISIANKYVNGNELIAKKFTGGDATNDFLIKLGFEVVPKNRTVSRFPIESSSWTILSELVFIKEMDRSSFLHNGTGIPIDIREYFSIGEITKGERKPVILKHKDITYPAVIEIDNQENPRTRLMWKSEFSNLIKNELPDWYYRFTNAEEINAEDERPKMRLEKVNPHDITFTVQFINPTAIYEDIQTEKDDTLTSRVEGGVKTYFVKKYERDTKNREKAIAIHGTVCKACGFDFEKIYGEHGRGYIEIHHKTPLSTLEEEIKIDPETDLIPVCSNCHRMIHRNKDKVLSIEEIKEILLSTQDRYVDLGGIYDNPHIKHN
ncbi:MAG: hypothetical protein K0R93_669 [Anaerosolibacter sp.]|jgi:5-methylcytosine-specific restriction protein A|uniref:HNH endonuclease n=1 Tax=Anaerosolibacter sp. TaxID=1872527 RepID=UPI002612D7CF|nr:HNH endonuclease [Anaerosolibacter sp.]MDF2545771.1 hypothetical protein [Anaerosolibacter sp.]